MFSHEPGTPVLPRGKLNLWKGVVVLPVESRVGEVELDHVLKLNAAVVVLRRLIVLPSPTAIVSE